MSTRHHLSTQSSEYNHIVHISMEEDYISCHWVCDFYDNCRLIILDIKSHSKFDVRLKRNEYATLETVNDEFYNLSGVCIELHCKFRTKDGGAH